MIAEDDAVSSCPCCQFVVPKDLFIPPKRPSLSNSTHSKSEPLEVSSESKDNNPRDAWDRLREQHVACLVDTHNHAHLERQNLTLPLTAPFSEDTLYLHDQKEQQSECNAVTGSSASELRVISLTCAVEPSDWNACLAYAAKSPHRMAALGVHPWYIESVVDAAEGSTMTCLDDVAAAAVKSTTNLQWLRDLELHLQQHPHCMVGEIGLCKGARFVRTFSRGKAAALALQRTVFALQLKLAVKYQRPVSVHCVDQYGVLLEVLHELLPTTAAESATNMEWSRIAFLSTCTKATFLPPAIALHSFSGSAHQVKVLLEWEARAMQSNSNCRYTETEIDRPLLYFGFSHLINALGCNSEKTQRRALEAIRSVPRNRILSESDVHTTSDVASDTAGAVAYISTALGEPINLVARLVAKNGLRFLQTIVDNSFDNSQQWTSDKRGNNKLQENCKTVKK